MSALEDPSRVVRMHDQAQLQSPEGQRLLATLRGVTARLPEVQEVIEGFGHTTFEARKRLNVDAHRSAAPKRLARLMQLFIALIAVSACSDRTGYVPRNGDIVFQVSQSAQSRAIRLATSSRYSHMGIVYLRDGVPFVFEAVQPVKLTPLNEWVARGDEGHFVAKRLRDAQQVLSPKTLRRMLAIGEEFAGRDYDLYFEWSDDRIYCSELVWKVFDRGAGIRIGDLSTIQDFDLSHPVVDAKLRERFGDSVPLQETVISPAAMLSSGLLETVYEN